MRCHYEVLGIERDADDLVIKKSYRKLALQHHPDKNPDNIAECTLVFNEIQAAYDVLSDMQERAWYDKHRDQILMGAGTDYVDENIELMHYFNTSVYKGFGDDETGFYAVYRAAFERIASEDEQYMDDDDEREFPTFGDSQSLFEDVVKLFYGFWLGYFTKKPYNWADKYDLRQAPNRPTQRLMEKENKKLREAAKRERNEEVRALVAFVRKRDRRVIAHRELLEQKNKENQAKVEKKRLADKLERNKQMESYEEQEWMSFDNMQGQLENIEHHLNKEFGSPNSDTLDLSDEEDAFEKLYCIACDKAFKSEKALCNHEKSKKHKENIELIRSELDPELLDDLRDSLKLGEKSSEQDKQDEEQEEDDSVGTEYLLSGAAVGINRVSSLQLPQTVIKQAVIEKIHDEPTDEHEISVEPYDENVFYISDPEEDLLKVKERKKKLRKNPSSSTSDSDDSVLGSLARNSLEITKPVSKKKAREAKRKKKLSAIQEKIIGDEDEDDEDDYDDDDDDEQVFTATNEANKGTCERLPTQSETTVGQASTTVSLNSTAETPEPRIGNDATHTDVIIDDGKLTDESKHTDEQSEDKLTSATVDENTGNSPKTNAKKKKAKKKQNNGSSMDVPSELHHCGVCGNDYPTRNKLFEHMKAERHTVPKDKIWKNEKGNGKKGKNK